MKTALIVLFFGTSLVYTLLYHDLRIELDEIKSTPIEANLDSIALCYVASVADIAIFSDTVNTTDNIAKIKCRQYEMALYEIRYHIGIILPLKKEGLYDSIIILQVRHEDEMINLK